MPPPRAILAVSAHWFVRGVHVTAMPQPRTIHDFGGFPRALYEVRFRQKDIWPDYAGPDTDTLDIDIYEHWLVRI